MNKNIRSILIALLIVPTALFFAACSCAVSAVTAVAVSAPPAKTTFQVGEVFDPTGMKINVTRADGSIENDKAVTLEMINGDAIDGDKKFKPETVGSQQLSVTCEGVSAAFSVTVIPAQIRIALAAPSNFQIIPLPRLASWSSVENANGYIIRIVDAATNELVQEKTVEAGTIQLSLGELDLAVGDYKVSVCATGKTVGGATYTDSPFTEPQNYTVQGGLAGTYVLVSINGVEIDANNEAATLEAVNRALTESSVKIHIDEGSQETSAFLSSMEEKFSGEFVSLDFLVRELTNAVNKEYSLINVSPFDLGLFIAAYLDETNVTSSSSVSEVIAGLVPAIANEYINQDGTEVDESSLSGLLSETFMGNWLTEYTGDSVELGDRIQGGIATYIQFARNVSGFLHDCFEEADFTESDLSDLSKFASPLTAALISKYGSSFYAGKTPVETLVAQTLAGSKTVRAKQAWADIQGTGFEDLDAFIDFVAIFGLDAAEINGVSDGLVDLYKHLTINVEAEKNFITYGEVTVGFETEGTAFKLNDPGFSMWGKTITFNETALTVTVEIDDYYCKVTEIYRRA